MSVVAVPDQIEEEWSATAVPRRNNILLLWKLGDDVLSELCQTQVHGPTSDQLGGP